MSDWLKSEFCTTCEGDGFVKFKSHETEEYAEFETEQCAECENLEKNGDKLFKALKEFFV